MHSFICMILRLPFDNYVDSHCYCHLDDLVMMMIMMVGASHQCTPWGTIRILRMESDWSFDNWDAFIHQFIIYLYVSVTGQLSESLSLSRSACWQMHTMIMIPLRLDHSLLELQLTCTLSLKDWSKTPTGTVVQALPFLKISQTAINI